MSTYSLTLRESLNRKLTITEMDNNFRYLQDIANNASGGTSSLVIDTNQIIYGTGDGVSSTQSFTFDTTNKNVGLGSSNFEGSCRSNIIASNGAMFGSCGSTILGGNAIVNNNFFSNNDDPSICFYGSPYGGSIYGGSNNLITSGNHTSYRDGDTTYIYNKINSSYCSSDSVIIGGFCNQNNSSDGASIIGGCCNINQSSSKSSIIGSHAGCVNNSNLSSIIGGCRNIVSNSSCSGLFSGVCNRSCYTCNSTILGGFRNFVCGYDGSFSGCSSLIGGNNNKICLSDDSSIIGGFSNEICLSDNSSIIGGYNNLICYNVDHSSIVGGYSNRINCNSDGSGILGGYYNDILNSSRYSSIIGGRNNEINNSCNSVILGGNGLTLSNVYNTVLVDNLMVAGDLTDSFGNPIVGGGIIQGTYSEILTLKNNSDLVTGQKYKISDIADTGIILEATSDNTFAYEASAGFLNADYQRIGNYSDVVGFVTQSGLWYSGIETPIILFEYFPVVVWRTNDVTVLSLTLNDFARTENSEGVVISTVDNNDGSYDISYVVISYDNVDFRNDTSFTQGLISTEVGFNRDSTQNYVADDRIITTNTGVTSSVLSSYENNGNKIDLSTPISIGTSSYFYTDDSPSSIYGSIVSYNLTSSNNSVVVWNEAHWLTTDYTTFNGTSPDSNTFSYVQLSKTASNAYGYIEEWDKVKYDIDTNSFGLRSDKRGNKLTNNNFPWGSDEVLNVVSESSTNNICVVLSSNDGGGGNYGLSGFSDSIIVGGGCNTIYNSDCAAILGGNCNSICGGSTLNNYGYGYGFCNPDYSSIVGGAYNTIYISDYSPIIGGCCNTVCASDAGGIFGGSCNLVSYFSEDSTIIGGCDNCVCGCSEQSSIIGGSNNRINYESCCSSILSGRNNNMCFSDTSTILGGNTNRMMCNCNSTVVGGDWACLYETCASGVLAGAGNRIMGSTVSGFAYRDAIVGGRCNHICDQSNDSVIIGGCRNIMCNSDTSTILGGNTNRMNCNCNSVVAGGDWACMYETCASGVFAGAGNRIMGSTVSGFAYRDAIIGGHQNHICNQSNDSVIIGGCDNIISCSNNSVVLGGSCLTLDNESNKVLVSKLKINQVDLNLGDSKLLILDSVGNVSFRTFESFTGSNGGIIVGATESMTGFMNQICISNNSSLVGGGYNSVCCNSNSSSIIGGFNNSLNNYSSTSTILGGHLNIINSSCDSSIIGGLTNSIGNNSCHSSIIGGCRNHIEKSCDSTILGGYGNLVCCSHCSTIIGGYSNEICGYDGNCQYGSSILGGIYNNIYDGVDNSSIIGGYSNDICYCSDRSTVVGGCNNLISNYSQNSTITGGCNNNICCSSNSIILGGYCNRHCDSDCSSIIGGYANSICGIYYGSSSRGSSILGGIYNCMFNGACRSSIIGGYSNDVTCNSCDSSIIGGRDNSMCCSCNSVILGGHDLSVCNRNNTVFLNGTTNFKQTIEVSVEDSVASTPKSIDFNTGAVKYLSSLSTDFQVDFTNIPTIANTTITYTLILNQGATPHMITGLTINAGSLETIKWANATEPEGNADQVDIVGLMFIFGTSGTLSQVLGQMGTFA